MATDSHYYYRGFDSLGGFDGLELDGLRTLRATTMLRMAGDRMHRDYVAGTLDERSRCAVDKAIAELNKLDPAVASAYSANLVAAGVSELADALDADDHVIGQAELEFAGAMLVATALVSDWEIGTLSPF